jgi:hypothetical protein
MQQLVIVLVRFILGRDQKTHNVTSQTFCRPLARVELRPRLDAAMKLKCGWGEVLRTLHHNLEGTDTRVADLF